MDPFLEPKFTKLRILQGFSVRRKSAGSEPKQQTHFFLRSSLSQNMQHPHFF